MVEDGNPVGLDLLRAQLNDEPRCRIATAPPSPDTFSASALYASCRQSVVLVGKVFKCGKCHHWHTAVASGFVISREGAIVTNYHVLAADSKAAGIAVRTWDGRLLTVEKVLCASKVHDLLVLKVNADDLVPLPIADQAPVGTQVFCLSHPVNHFYTLTQGIVSGYFKHRGFQDMAITADFAKGSSGAPILDCSGAVVGIVRATVPVYYEKKDGVDTKMQMVWKYCVPSASLLELLK